MNRLQAAALLFFLFASCHSPVALQKTESVFYTPQNTGFSPSDSTLLAMTTPYRQKLDETMNEVLARSGFPLEKGQPESKLGNFVADLCFQTGRVFDGTVDFCVLNNGGLRSALPAGDITRRHAYELMPFDNELVVVTLSPDSVISLLNYIAEKGGVPVANIRMKIGNGKPEDVMIGGNAYDPAKTYKIVTSDYLANGGDAMMMFSNPVKSESTGIKVRDAIINFLSETGKKQSFIEAETDGRISR